MERGLGAGEGMMGSKMGVGRVVWTMDTEIGGKDGKPRTWDGAGKGVGCWNGDRVGKEAWVGSADEVRSGAMFLCSLGCSYPFSLLHVSPHLPSPASPRPSTSDRHLSHLSRYVVHLGEHNLQRRDGCEQTRTATESFPHPDFNNSLPNKDHRNDIMLVKMATAAFITRAVRPLTLSSRCVTPGTRCLISGWGTTSSPQCRGSRGGHGGGRVIPIVEEQREPEEPSEGRVLEYERGLPGGVSSGISQKEEGKHKSRGGWRLKSGPWGQTDMMCESRSSL